MAPADELLHTIKGYLMGGQCIELGGLIPETTLQEVLFMFEDRLYRRRRGEEGMPESVVKHLIFEGVARELFELPESS